MKAGRVWVLAVAFATMFFTVLSVVRADAPMTTYQMTGYTFKCPSSWEANLKKVSGFLLTPEAVAARDKSKILDLIAGMKVDFERREQRNVDFVTMMCKKPSNDVTSCDIEHNAGGPHIDEYIMAMKNEETGNFYYYLDMSIPLSNGIYLGVSANIPQQGDKKFPEIYNRFHDQYRLVVKSVVIQKEK